MFKDMTIVRVGISDLKIAQYPQRIRTSGLGSCIGIVIYDLTNKIAGLAHIMLPDSNLSRQSRVNELKYVDTAIPIMIEKLCKNGAKRKSLKSKIAGGAQMFPFSEADVMKIGFRNIESTRAVLKRFNIPLIASDVGGNRGRTIEFDPGTGQLFIRTVGKKEFYI